MGISEFSIGALQNPCCLTLTSRPLTLENKHRHDKEQRNKEGSLCDVTDLPPIENQATNREMSRYDVRSLDSKRVSGVYNPALSENSHAKAFPAPIQTSTHVLVYTNQNHGTGGGVQVRITTVFR